MININSLNKKLKSRKLAKDSKEGFTIIEVVLVLAIAGLIFLIVFLALPQLQSTQRDAQRRSDLGRFMSALETYASNNNGRYPQANDQAVNAFEQGYLTNQGAQFNDPLEDSYNYSFQDPSGVGLTSGTIYYQEGAFCGDQEGTFESDGAGSRNIAAMVPLENGIAYCLDNR
ncbi:MAG: type II secretion system protein [Candidatus Saccharimonadales bacterium]